MYVITKYLFIHKPCNYYNEDIITSITMFIISSVVILSEIALLIILIKAFDTSFLT